MKKKLLKRPIVFPNKENLVDLLSSLDNKITKETIESLKYHNGTFCDAFALTVSLFIALCVNKRMG